METAGLPRWARPLGPLFIPVAAVVRAADLRVLRPGDIVFFQRPLTELPMATLERFVAGRHATVFDFDDAIHLTWQNQRKFGRLMALCDAIIAGNATLAEAAGVPQKTWVIPTAIDTERFRPLPPNQRRGAEVVIVWTGIARNYPQLLVAAPVLRGVLEATGATLRIISDAPPPRVWGHARVEYRRWSAATELADLVDVDIGLMPLPDTPYARGKCAFKLLQVMALGRPAVASAVGVNREVIRSGENGFLASSDRQWQDALSALIDDPGLRGRMGAAARAQVEAGYALPALLPRYAEVLRRVGAPAPA